MMKHPGWLAAPVVAATLLLVVAPLLITLALSMFRFDALSPPQWVGLAHFLRMAEDPLLRQAVTNSLTVGVISLPLRLGLALVLALLFAPPTRTGHAGLVLIVLPVLLPEIVWAMVWLWLLNPYFGPAAALLDQLRPLGAQWLLSASGARSAIVLTTALLVGEMVLILVIARRRVAPAHYALCAIEGASRWTMFRRVTLPALWPMLVLLCARDLALGPQLTYWPALIVTKTGPQFATYFLPHLIYQNAFEYLRFGYAAAVSSLLIVLILCMAVAQAWILHRWHRAQGL